MATRKLEKKLNRFLRREGVYHLFLNRMKESEHSEPNIKQLVKHAECYNFIISAFIFGKEQSFWMRLSNKWRKEFKWKNH